MTGAYIRDGARSAADDRGIVRVRDLLTSERVKVPLDGQDKDAIVAELADAVVRAKGLETQRAEILTAVRQREEVLSTGIGEGVALPHAKYNGLDELVMAAGVSLEPIEFGALDGKPVRLFFLMLGPDTTAGTQVRVLSRISRLMRDSAFREELVAAEDADHFLRVLEEAERAI